jgi:hypothetical protein
MLHFQLKLLLLEYNTDDLILTTNIFACYLLAVNLGSILTTT